MRQFFYVSDSLIGTDVVALDRVMVQARTNNALDGITGLLWTDGRRFAQVVEGGEVAIDALIERLRADPRHENIRVVHDAAIDARAFGDWAMNRPAIDDLAAIHERRILDRLAAIDDAVSPIFAEIIAESHATG